MMPSPTPQKILERSGQEEAESFHWKLCLGNDPGPKAAQGSRKMHRDEMRRQSIQVSSGNHNVTLGREKKRAGK